MKPLGDEVPNADKRDEAPADIGERERLHSGDEPEDGSDPESEVQQADRGTEQIGVGHAAVLGEGGVGGPDEAEGSPVAAGVVQTEVKVWGDEQGAEGEACGQGSRCLRVANKRKGAAPENGADRIHRGVLIAMHGISVPVVGVVGGYERWARRGTTHWLTCCVQAWMICTSAVGACGFA
ncbi:hypothetical protein ASF71_20940 [Deinococcus sp. Leaf326]|nr:hypothetical protein ASF71_20940 [Deinococcus sp. Leaf326]